MPFPGASGRKAGFALLLAAVALAFGAGAFFLSPRPAPVAEAGAGTAAIGGPFRLLRQDGGTMTEADVRGRPFAVFFGFTHCPEICPTTLFEMSEALQALGPDGDRLRVLFVSVDPERDTPAVLKRYLGSFDPRIVGLTGSRAAVDAMAEAYRATWRKVPTEGGGYTMDHTASLYLMDAEGRFSGLVPYGEAAGTRLDKLRRLIAGQPV